MSRIFPVQAGHAHYLVSWDELRCTVPTQREWSPVRQQGTLSYCAIPRLTAEMH